VGAALGTYSAGWVSVGLLIIELSVKLGFNLDLFVVPNIPLSSDEFALLVSTATGLVSSVVVAVDIYRQASRRLAKALRPLLSGYRQIATGLKLSDMRLAFLDKAIQVEKRLRTIAGELGVAEAIRRPPRSITTELVQRELMDERLGRLLNLIRRTRNLIVHGESIDSKTLSMALWGADRALEELEKIRKKES